MSTRPGCNHWYVVLLNQQCLHPQFCFCLNVMLPDVTTVPHGLILLFQVFSLCQSKEQKWLPWLWMWSRVSLTWTGSLCGSKRTPSFTLETIKEPLIRFGESSSSVWTKWKTVTGLFCIVVCVLILPSSFLSSLEKKSLLRDNVDLLVSLADVYFRAGDTKNAILKFEQAQMLDPYLIKGELQHYLLTLLC